MSHVAAVVSGRLSVKAAYNVHAETGSSKHQVSYQAAGCVHDGCESLQNIREC